MEFILTIKILVALLPILSDTIELSNINRSYSDRKLGVRFKAFPTFVMLYFVLTLDYLQVKLICGQMPAAKN